MKLTQAQIASVGALTNEAGQIRPSQVMAAAKVKQHPLHSLFDWNQKNAAEKYWLHRAREIIGAVTIQVTTEHFLYKAPAYIVDTTVKGQGYRSTIAMSADPSSALESLVYTLEVAAGHLRRAMDLAVPLGLSGEIDRLLMEIAGVQRVVRLKAA